MSRIEESTLKSFLAAAAIAFALTAEAGATPTPGADARAARTTARSQVAHSAATAPESLPRSPERR